MKFKKGDEVIVVRSSFENGRELGWVGTITEAKPKTNQYYVFFEHVKTPLRYYRDDLELLLLYNSPLYQALL